MYLKNRHFCSEFLPVDFLRKLTIIFKVATRCSPACFCSHILMVRAQVGCPALQGWSFCRDFQLSSQTVLLSAHPPSQPDTQKFKGILWHCCEVKREEALHTGIDRELFEPKKDLISVFYSTLSSGSRDSCRKEKKN